MARPNKIIKENVNAQGRTCPQCKKKVLLSDYYNNARNYEWHVKDKWCKNCVKKFVKDLETLQLYCRYNNRVFAVELYQAAEVVIDDNLKNDDKYNSLTDIDKRAAYRFQKIFVYYTKRMNLPQYYQFENNDFDAVSVIKDKEQEIYQQNIDHHIEHMAEDVVKAWDDTWYGEYSNNELSFLNSFYDKLQMQFEISDAQMDITVKEAAKSALEMNQAYNAMRAGEAGAAVRYQNARDSFIKLSDNAKLSASKRTANDRVGFSDLGSLIKRVENSGALMRKVTFPKDDVDNIRNDFRHILASFNGEDLSGGDK